MGSARLQKRSRSLRASGGPRCPAFARFRRGRAYRSPGAGSRVRATHAAVDDLPAAAGPSMAITILLRDTPQIAPEGGIRNVDAFSVDDVDAASGSGAKHTEGHGDSMIAMRFDGAGERSVATANRHSIRKFFGLHTDGLEVTNHSCDPVAFLVAQFAGAGDHRFAFRARRQTRKHRNFVDHRWHFGGAYRDRRERITSGSTDGGDWLAPDVFG